MRRRTLIALLAAALALPAGVRAAEVRTHGLVDLALTSGEDARTLDLTTQGDSNFDPYRVRLFVDASVSPTLEFYLQAIVNEGYSSLRADGAYAQWTPWPQLDLHVQAGKIPWPVGTWAPRTYSDKNPLIGMPLMYQYHTSLAWDVPTGSVDQLVTSAGTGQYGVSYGGQPVSPMAVVDDRWWDTGVVAIGARAPFEFSFGAIQGSPGWPVNAADDTPGQTTLGRVGVMPAAGVRAGVSGVWGTWMPVWFSYALPAGHSLRDYHEWIGMGDLELERGPLELRGEGFLKGWQTMATGTLRLGGGYGEARLGLWNGAWLAARMDAIRFGTVRTSDGGQRPWDDGVDRLETGVGYRVSRDVRVKAVLQRNVLYGFGQKPDRSDLFALAASIRF